MEIYNVLIKGVEIHITPFCKAFKSYDEAALWAGLIGTKNNWQSRSTLHGGGAFEENSNVDDIRFEDENGNSFYAVIYKQQLN